MNFLKTLIGFLITLLKEIPKSGIAAFILLFQAIYQLLLRLLQLLIRLFQGKRDEDEGNQLDKCFEIPPDVARRPDPCLYSQHYLASQGLAVTWDNPDIIITHLDGTPANLPLDPDRDYLVLGTIHNASFDPALGVAVRCFVRPWGVDFQDRVPTEVDNYGQPATRIVHIGAWGQATTVFKWRTPNVDKAHYCVTVECYHPADREPANNVGQENTDILRKANAGSTVNIIVPFYNRHENVRTFRITVDSYEIKDEPIQFRLEQIRGPNGIAKEQLRTLMDVTRSPGSILQEPEKLRRLVDRDAMRGARIRLSPEGRRVRRGVGYRLFGYHGAAPFHDVNRAGKFPLPPGWMVDFPKQGQDNQGAQVIIPAGTTQNLEAVITVPRNAQPGERRHINLTAFNPANQVVGGVTLDIEVSEVNNDKKLPKLR